MNKQNIGVYLCECGGEVSNPINLKAIRSLLSEFDNIAFVKQSPVLCVEKAREQIQEDIRSTDLTRVVIGGCSPKVYEKRFKRTLEEAGLNPEYLQMANIREQCAYVHEGKKATEKAKKLLSAAIERVKLHESPSTKEFDVHPSTVIVGGGITGMKTALTVAENGKQVYLIEKEASLGGRMKYLSKIFLGDLSMCSSNCILRQMITSIQTHPNIEVFVNSQIKDVSRNGANFELDVHKEIQFVDEDRCIRCGKCEEVCPQPRDGMEKWAGSSQKAIYTPLPNEFKDAPSIDTSSCLHFTKDECTKCQDVCPADAINFDKEKPDSLHLTTGAVLLTTGAQLFDPNEVEAYGYGKYDNVITAPELELLSKPSGPTNGKIVTKEGEVPEEVAILHCVGSRDPRYNEYCSNVCCMYCLKVAKMLKEKLPNTDIYELYIDMRTAEQGYESLYRELRDDGVHFIRGKGAEILQDKERNKLLVQCEDTGLGMIREIPVDLAVLGVGIEPTSQTVPIAEDFGLQLSDEGFYETQHPKLSSVTTDIEGVFIAGDTEWPKDIPNALEQADAAAASILSYITQGKVKEVPVKLHVNEDTCSNCGLCVSTCPYTALSLGEETVEVNEILCQGCGNCVSTCPTHSLSLLNSTDEQIQAEITALTQKREPVTT